MNDENKDVQEFQYNDGFLDRVLGKINAVTFKKYFALRTYTDGLKKRHEDEISKGKDEILKWRDAAALRGLPGATYINESFIVDDELCSTGAIRNYEAQIKTEVLLALGESKSPNDAQWRMILSENPSVCVNAGAGSGKSTTLIIRLYVMRRYLNVDWNEITVFTYTKNSRKDLIEKTLETFEKLNESITEDIAKDVIRTFHSFAALEIGRTNGISLKSVFEIYCSAPKRIQSDEELFADFITTQYGDGDVYDVDNPMSQSYKKNTKDDPDYEANKGTKNRQNAELKAIYHLAYEESEDFRNKIAALYLTSLPTNSSRSRYKAGDTKEGSAKSLVKKQDYEATANFENYWRDRIARSDPAGAYFQLETKKIRINNSDEEYYFNGLIKANGRPVYFCVDSDCRLDFNFKNANDVQRHINAKIKILNTSFEKQFHVIRSESDLENIINILKWHADFLKGCAEAPSFDYVPSGEIPAKDSHIFMRMYSTIQFIENHALDVSDCLHNINGTKLSGYDSTYIDACKIFFQHLLKHFSDLGLITFNQLFTRINTRKMDFARGASKGAKLKLKHLLIDEFQDICPLYAEYIKAMKLALYEEGEAGSLMVIGDDFQSIYGWKGSSPDYFSRYDEQFRSRNKPENILMELNYRSTQPIIDFAECLLTSANSPLGQLSKKGLSIKTTSSAHKPQIYFHEFEKRDDKLLFEEIEKLILREAESIQASAENPVFVMARRNAPLDFLEERLKNRKNIRFLTFHSSKGLEANSTILIESCFYDSHNPIKNEIVRQFLGKDTYKRFYDDAQKDEASRLAYVAASRAKYHCYWIIPENDDSTLAQRIRKETKLCDASKLETFKGQRLLTPAHLYA